MRYRLSEIAGPATCALELVRPALEFWLSTFHIFKSGVLESAHIRR